MSEIRLDVRLLRPGALVAGVAAGRCVLVRAVPEPGGAAAWIAAAAAGLPVPAVREARCGERHVLVVPAIAGQPLSAAVGDAARSQAAALGLALAGHGVAVSVLRRDDLAVCDGVLAVRAPVVGPADDGDGAAGFAAMVVAACAPEPVVRGGRRQRAVPAAVVAVAALAAVVSLVPWPGAGGPDAPRAAAAIPAAPRVVVPEIVPTAGSQPPVARVRKRTVKPKSKKMKPKQRRAVAPSAAEAPARVRPSPSSLRRSVRRPTADVPVAGGDADPLPAL